MQRSFILILLAAALSAVIASQLRAENPWANRRVKVEANCDVATSQRRDCGFLGITPNVCLNSGCCWQPPPSGVSAPWCYFAASEAPTRSPTFAPSAAPTTGSPTATPTTAAPSISIAPSTISPTRTPTHQPTSQAGTASSGVKSDAIIAAIVVVALIIIGASIFLIYAYCYIYRTPVPAEEKKKNPEKLEKLEKLETKTITSDSRDNSYMSIYSSNRYDNFRYNRRDLANDTIDFEEDEFYNSGNHRPISWYEDQDHGFVN